MTDTDPPWLANARALIGKVQDGPSILPLAAEIGSIYPDMAAYCRMVQPDTAWCGLFVGHCMTRAGIRPPYDPSEDTRSFLWAQAWKLFGTEVSQPRLGDVLVFARHVTFYAGEDADHYHCLGGNQSDGVNITSFAKSNCEAILRPPAAAALPVVNSTAGVDGHIVFTTAPSSALWSSGRGSWYSQFDGKFTWRDSGDAPGSAALGVPDPLQGVSFYNHPTLGDWFEVEAPNGARSIEQQTDIGPNPKTGRSIDISAAAAERFGYSPKNFPTDSTFRWRPIAVPVGLEHLTPQKQAAAFVAMRGNPPVPQPENPPVTDTTTAPAPSLLPRLDPQRIIDFVAANPDCVKMLTAFLAAMRGEPITTVTPPPAPTPIATPAAAKPSVQLSVWALAAGAIAQVFGVVGTPFGMGADPTTAGTLATLVPIVSTLVGATGGWGAVASVAIKIVGGLATALAAKKPAA